MVQVNKNKRYVIEAIVFLSYVFFSVSWLAGSKVTPQIVEYFNLDALPAAVTNAITISKIIGNLAAAWFLMKLGPKKAIALSSLLIAIVGLGAFATSFPLFIVTRFIMGFGGALMVVYFGPVVMYYFEPEKRPLVNGINSVANNIGNIIALVMVGPIINALGRWQSVILVFAGISLVLLIIWLVVGEDFPIASKGNSASGESTYGYSKGLREAFNYKFGLAYSGWLTLYIVMLNLFPLNDSIAVDASLLSTLLAVAGVVATPFGIILAKKTKKKKPVIYICGILGPLVGVLMIMTTSVAVATVSAFALGFLIFLPMTTFVTIPQQLKGMTPAKLTVVMAMFWSISYIVETVLYTWITNVVNTSGFQTGMLIAVACSLTFLIFGAMLPETGTQK